MFEFHDSTENEMYRKIFQEKESMWLELMDKALDNKSWSDKEIKDVLHSIQEFVWGDFPEKRVINAESLRYALDNMTRVAIALSNGQKNIDRHYITHKLYQVLKNLKTKDITL